jgi:tetratricopeptide (TPR) repeat protein
MNHPRCSSRLFAAGPGSSPAADVLVLLVLASLLAGGCSLNRFAHRGATEVKSARRPDGPLGFREQSALHPAEPYWLFRLGQWYFAADSLPQAQAALEASLARDPVYAPSMALLSKLDFVTGRNQEAVKMLEPVRAHPEAFADDIRPSLLAGLAIHQDALGHPEAAEEAIAKLDRPDLRQTGSALVYVRLRGPHPESADSLAAAALERNPGSAVDLNNDGITRLRAGDVTGARRAFQSAAERDPSLPGPYYNLAILEKYYLFDETAAVGDFRKYWARSHDDPDSLLSGFSDAVTKTAIQKGN